MNEPKTPEEVQRESTAMEGDGAGQQTKVGHPYDGKGDVQTGVRDRMQSDAEPREVKRQEEEYDGDRSLRED